MSNLCPCLQNIDRTPPACLPCAPRPYTFPAPPKGKHVLKHQLQRYKGKSDVIIIPNIRMGKLRLRASGLVSGSSAEQKAHAKQGLTGFKKRL